MLGNIGSVTVRTVNNRGFTPAELASQCVERIVSVADTAPEPLRAQVIAFRRDMEALICRCAEQAVDSDRTTVCNALREAGHPELATLIRRL